MKQFKEIKVVFHAKNDLLNYKIVVERKHSAMFEYGDQSCHIVKVYEWGKDDKYIADYFYDTRYNRIDIEKDKWIDFWKDYITQNYQHHPRVTLIEYEEREVTL